MFFDKKARHSSTLWECRWFIATHHCFSFKNSLDRPACLSMGLETNVSFLVWLTFFFNFYGGNSADCQVATVYIADYQVATSW